MEDLAMACWKESIFAMQIMFSELRCTGKKNIEPEAYSEKEHKISYYYLYHPANNINCIFIFIF